jgi:hypothetical protein
LEAIVAIIITLPTAAKSPVINPRRRGRFPRGVSSIWTARVIRNRRATAQSATAKAAEEIRMWGRLISTAQAEYAAAQIRAAQLSKQ